MNDNTNMFYIPNTNIGIPVRVLLIVIFVGIISMIFMLRIKNRNKRIH